MVDTIETNPHLEEIRRLEEGKTLLRLIIRHDQTRLAKIPQDIELEKIKAFRFVLERGGLITCTCAGRWICGRHTKEREMGLVHIEDAKFLYEDAKFLYREERMIYLKQYLTYIDLYCSGHFPQNPNEASKDRATSEVLVTDGKLVRVVDGVEVTNMPILNRYPRELFKYFSLPLPISMQLNERIITVDVYTFRSDPNRIEIKT